MNVTPTNNHVLSNNQCNTNSITKHFYATFLRVFNTTSKISISTPNSDERISFTTLSPSTSNKKTKKIPHTLSTISLPLSNYEIIFSRQPSCKTNLNDDTKKVDALGNNIHHKILYSEEDMLKYAILDFFSPLKADANRINHSFSLPEANWSKLAKNVYAMSFVKFAHDLLHFIKENDHNSFVDATRMLMSKLLHYSGLAEIIFSIAGNGQIRNPQFFLPTFYRMLYAAIAEDTKMGIYDNSTGQLMQLSQEIFRIELLSCFTRNYLKNHPTHRYSELYLSLLSKSANEIGIKYMPVPIPRETCIIDVDITQLSNIIKENESKHFDNWFMQSAPLREYVCRHHPYLAPNAVEEN